MRQSSVRRFLLTTLAAAVLSACSSATESRAPTSVEAITGTALQVTAGAAVSPSPAVRVFDQDGLVMQGIPVTFQVLGGGGTVVGENATTDAQGAAVVGSWTTGPAAGTNTLSATVGSLPPVIFTATATTACVDRTPLSVDVAVNGALEAGDCLNAGILADNYSLTTTAGQAVNITLSSTAFDAFLMMSNPAGTVPVAQNNDDGPGTTNSRVKVITAGGVHTVTATSLTAGASGAYTLQAANTNPSAETCELVFMQLGATTEQTLSPTDCQLYPGFFDDQFRVYVVGGTQIRVTARSTVVDAYLELYAPTGVWIMDDDDSGGGTDAQIMYTATTTGYYIVSASSSAAGETGAYTLTVESLSAATQPAAQSSR